jgi:hypothetical protein
MRPRQAGRRCRYRPATAQRPLDPRSIPGDRVRRFQVDPIRAAPPTAVAAGEVFGDRSLPAVGDQGLVNGGRGFEDRRDAQRAGGVGQERLQRRAPLLPVLASEVAPGDRQRVEGDQHDRQAVVDARPLRSGVGDHPPSVPTWAREPSPARSGAPGPAWRASAIEPHSLDGPERLRHAHAKRIRCLTEPGVHRPLRSRCHSAHHSNAQAVLADGDVRDLGRAPGDRRAGCPRPGSTGSRPTRWS